MSILDEYGIERDPRFERAAKEAKVAISLPILWVIYCIAIMYWGSIMYTPDGPTIAGLPVYLFFILLGVPAVVIIGVALSLFYIEDASLEAWGEQDG